MTRGRDRRWLVAVAVAAVLVVLATSGCVSHLAAPARTADGYQAAVGKTVTAAGSSVATAELLADTADRGHAFFPYLAGAITDAEDDLGATVDTFASIQPPDGESVALRTETLDALRRAQDHVSAVRIALRAGSTAGLPELADELAADADALKQLEPS